MNETRPLVSVIMPILNEAAFIERSLGAVLAQDYPRECLEILVVDGMSDDRTRSLVTELALVNPHLHLLDNPGRIVSTAMNIGIQAARGEIIVRVDGHTEIAENYVSQCVRGLQETEADNVGGRMDAAGNTPFGESIAVATSTPFGVGDAQFHYANVETWVDTVYLGAWRRELFDRIGMFDEELSCNQDDEFNYRLRKHGGRILLRPAIRSVYTARSTPQKLWRQYYQYGFWKVRVLQKHPAQMQLRQFIPPLFVLALTGSSLFALFKPIGRLILLLVSVGYIVANLFASLIAARQYGWKYFFRLPIVYFILHFSYGCGFLTGLIRFWKRWKIQNL